jgi:iron(III) transport system substrate-binding protein
MTEFDRRRFLELTAASVAFVGISGVHSAAWGAGSQQLEKAQAEGEAVFYANITAVEPVMSAFHDKTHVEGKYTRLSSSKFIPTILTEAGAGKLLADAVQAPRPMIELLDQNKVLLPYRSPSAEGYPAWATEKETMTHFGVEYVSYIYNTDQVKSADAPAKYEDLADPKWKDKIVMANPATHASTIGWLVALKEQVFKAEADWREFLKGLAANQPMFVESFGPTPAPVASGERLIGISMPKYIVTKAPAPLDWGPRSGPLFGTARTIALTANPPHPEAAKVFMDYWLSKEAMEIMATEVGEYVLAPGVYPKIDGIDKVEVKPVRDLSDDEFKTWGREFAEIFAAH